MSDGSGEISRSGARRLAMSAASALLVCALGLAAPPGGHAATTAANVGPALTAASAGPVPAAAIRRRFRIGNRPEIKTAMCRHDSSGFRVWWVPAGPDCAILSSQAQVALQSAIKARADIRALHLGTVRGDVRGHGSIPRSILTLTAHGLKKVRNVWPAGGNRNLDLFVLPGNYGLTGHGLTYCLDLGGNNRSTYIQVQEGDQLPELTQRTTWAHEMFHTAECLNRHLGLANKTRARRRNTINFDSRPLPVALVEGVANWFALVSYPAIARDAARGIDENGSPFVSMAGGVGTSPWLNCAGYDLASNAGVDAATSGGYETADIWLSYLAGRNVAANLKRAWKKLAGKTTNTNDLSAMWKAIGKTALSKALTNVFEDSCIKRVVPGIGGSISNDLYGALGPNQLLPSQVVQAPGSTVTSVSRQTIKAVFFSDADYRSANAIGDSLTYDITITGADGAAIVTGGASVAVPAGVPTRITVPTIEGGVLISLLNSRSSGTEQVSINATVE